MRRPIMSSHHEFKDSGCFVARDESGRSYTLSMRTEFVVATDSDGTMREPIACHIRTQDGQVVQRMGKGPYLIVATGEELTPDDSEAPRGPQAGRRPGGVN